MYYCARKVTDAKNFNGSHLLRLPCIVDGIQNKIISVSAPEKSLHTSSMANVRNMSNKRVSLTNYLLMLSFFLMQLTILVDAVTDRISQGQVMTHSETIVSPGNIFELGFFSFGNSTNYYVGIWCKNSLKTVVWVANRDQPVTSNSSILTINSEGNLVIEGGKFTYRVSDSVSSNTTSAILLDSGNFILRNENSDILWQSFESSSNTFLPGMKIGYSKKIGKVWSLTSWKDSEDPSFGDVEMKMDPKQPNEFFLMRGSQMLWSSGVWHDGVFTNMPEMRNVLINYSFYNDENETYFTYSAMYPSILTRFLIDGESGQAKLMRLWERQTDPAWFTIWAQPRECALSSGPFSICPRGYECICRCLHGFIPSDSWKEIDVSGGCLRRTKLQCENSTRSNVNGEKDRFLRMNDVSFPLSPQESTGRDAKECELACFNDCSCTAYAYNGSGLCSLWYGALLNLEQLSKNDPRGRTIYIKLAASEFQKPRGNRKLMWMVVIVVVLIPASYVFLKWSRELKKKETEMIETSQDILLFDIKMSIGTSMNGLSDGNISGKGKSKDAWFPLFSFASVSAATDNFSTKNKLGQGGFGPVYKFNCRGKVKRLSRQSGQGLEELKNGTMLIAKLQHRNLVRLLGCCMEQGEKILIYEYMPHKSLDSFLFDPTKKALLNWGTRARIIEGIAQGILYLHQYSRFRIIHRDLRASNILLDSDMNPKISDFVLARMCDGNELQANTKRIVGTYGYMSPEYALEGLFSIKSDVFSFGVLLMEIVSGKKNTGFYHSDALNLLGLAWDLWKDDRAQELMDPTLEHEASYPMLIRYINVALLCVQENAVDRPTMSEILSMLTNEHVALSCPKQPAFSYVRSVLRPPATRLEACSVNEVTLTLMEAR